MKNNQKNLTFLFTFLCLSFIFSSAFAQRGVKGSGNVIEQERTISGFDAIAVKDGVDVYIELGSAASVKVKADDNIQGMIKTEVVGNTLEIEVEGSIWRAEQMAVYVTMPDLEKIIASGGSDIYSTNTLNLDILEIYTSGGSDVNLELNAEELRCKTSGGSDLHLRGSVDRLLAKASGGSDLKAKELTVKKCELKTSGGSDAWVYVTEEIEMEASGASDIHYSGRPKVLYQRSSGASDIHGN